MYIQMHAHTERETQRDTEREREHKVLFFGIPGFD